MPTYLRFAPDAVTNSPLIFTVGAATSASTPLAVLRRGALTRTARTAHLCGPGAYTLCGAKAGRTHRTVDRPQGETPVNNLPLCNRCGRAILALLKDSIRQSRSRQLRRLAGRDQEPEIVLHGPMHDLFPTKLFFSR
jgi:hypothetical protein